MTKVGLLGTRFVMDEPFYRDRLKERFDIDILIPAEDEQATVHRIIYDELCPDGEGLGSPLP
jgi:aspartate racemase